MRNLFNLFVFVLAFITTSAQKNFSKFPAILTTTNNDTIRALLIISNHANNIELSNLYDKMTYIDSNGKEFTVRPNEHILSFQFHNNSTNYRFERITLNGTKKKKLEYGFGLCIIKGYMSLYQYSFDSENLVVLPGSRPNQPSVENYPQRHIYHFLQKRNELPSLVKTNPTLKGIPGNNERKWLRDYFKDYPHLAKKIGKEIETYDLETMVKEYNYRQHEKEH